MSSDSDQASTSGAAGGSNEPATVLAYPLPPSQYINDIDPDNLPTPPPPITEGFYHMFGQKISMDDAIIAPLEAHGTKRLYPKTDYDHKKELKKINASILVNFLDLIDVLVKCPDTDKRIEKCNDLATLFINFHHLINELRPHQARETLRVWLNTQRRTREDIIKKLNGEMDKMNKVLAEYQAFETEEEVIASEERIKSDKTATAKDNSTNFTTNSNNSNNQHPSVDNIICQIVDDFCS